MILYLDSFLKDGISAGSIEEWIKEHIRMSCIRAYEQGVIDYVNQPLEECINKQNIISAMSEIMEIDNGCAVGTEKQDEVIKVLTEYFGIPKVKNNIEIQRGDENSRLDNLEKKLAQVENICSGYTELSLGLVDVRNKLEMLDEKIQDKIDEVMLHLKVGF